MYTNEETNYHAMRTLNASLDMDGLTPGRLENYCTTAYRMDNTPLTAIRAYLRTIGLGKITVAHYLETDRWNAGTMDWIRKKCEKKTGPLVLVVVHKKNGYVIKTRIFYISGVKRYRESEFPKLKILK